MDRVCLYCKTLTIMQYRKCEMSSTNFNRVIRLLISLLREMFIFVLYITYESHTEPKMIQKSREKPGWDQGCLLQVNCNKTVIGHRD